MNNKKKILIAEDDKFLVGAYKLKLTKEGFDIRIASNGEEALKLLREDLPDVMLLDLIMPVKDGFSVLKEMNADPALSSVPVIIASNLGQKEDIEKGMSLGAKGFVVKSDLSLEDLVSKVKEVL